MIPHNESIVPSLHRTPSYARSRAALAVLAALALPACGSSGSDDETPSTVGRFLLVVAEDSIALYELPFLRPAGYVAFQTELRDAVLDPDEELLFVSAIDGANREISVFELDAQTGELDEVAGSPFAAPAGADSGLAVHPDGGFLYVGGTSLSAFSIASSGALSAVAGSPFALGTSPAALAFHPSGDFLYAANPATDDVSAFAVAADGSLTPLAGSRFTGGDQPSALAVTPHGDFLLVANTVSDDVASFEIGTDGALTPVPNSPFAGVDGPLDVQIDATGTFAFTANDAGGNAVVFAIDSTSGELTPTPGGTEPTGSMSRSLALDPDGELVHVLATGPRQLQTLGFDDDTGVLTAVRSVRTRSLTRRLLVTSGATRPTHRPIVAYAARLSGEVEGFAVSNVSGIFLELPSSPFQSSGTPMVLATDSCARFLYAGLDAAGGIDAYTIDFMTGELDSVTGSPFFLGKTFAQLVAEPSGRFLYAAEDELEAFAINQTTGALTPLAGSPYDLTLGGPVERLDVDPTGRFLLFSGDDSVGTCALDAVTGVPTLVGTPVAATGARTIFAAPNGRFAYAPSSTQVQLARLQIDAATGALSAAGTTVLDPQPLGAFHHPIGGLIALPHGTGVISAYLVAEATGVPTEVVSSPFADGEMPHSLAFEPSGRWLYALNSFGLVSIFEIGSNGALAQRGPAVAGLFNVPALVVLGRVQ